MELVFVANRTTFKQGSREKEVEKRSGEKK